MLFFIRTFSLLPLSVLYCIADYLLYPVMRYVIRYRLKVVRKNINQSFPKKTIREREQLINAFYHGFAATIVEVVYGYRVSDQEMRERVVFDNLELLENVAHQKKGVFLMFGHLGNWEWMADLGKRYVDSNIKEYNVYRQLRSPSADNAMKILRSKRGGGCIEKNQILRRLVTLRKENHPLVIGMIADQKPSPRSTQVWTTFLNQDTAFLTGTEVLARKFDFPVIYVHLESPKRGYYRAHFELITDQPTTTENGEITLKYAQYLETNIQTQPELWLWSHDRWKWGRPNPTAETQS